MANENLSDFSIQWIFFGFLFFCLLSFAVMFVANNNEDAFGTSSDKFNTSTLQSSLVSIPTDTDPLLNITSKSNPETGDLGDRSSVAVSYGLTGKAKTFIQSTQMFLSWIFIGTSGQIILSLFVGIFSITSLYFITKWIRQGA